MKSDRKPMGSRQKKINISMNERKKNMNSITSDVRVSTEVSDSTVKGAAERNVDYRVSYKEGNGTQKKFQEMRIEKYYYTMR